MTNAPPVLTLRTVPIFPLTGVVLLPSCLLPLHVFEPRYRNLVEDAMEAERTIGMIQPRTPSMVPARDHSPQIEASGTDAAEEAPATYPVGCIGRIEQCEAQSGGRFLIVLRGMQRFRVVRELKLERGYRRVEADPSEFAADLYESEIEVDPQPVLDALQQNRNAEVDFDQLKDLSGPTVVNGLAAALPFSPAEKQALLEAEGPEARRDLLASLLGMGFDLKALATDEPSPIN
ncbi:MAG: LON peptidase substrate-binding domain-containing protein [Acidobacteriota bacterium]